MQYIWNFNMYLTNDVVSFEQLGPECQPLLPMWAQLITHVYHFET